MFWLAASGFCTVCPTLIAFATSGVNHVSCEPDEVSEKSIIIFLDKLWRRNINNILLYLLDLSLTITQNLQSVPF